MRKSPSFFSYYTRKSDASLLLFEIPISYLKNASSPPVIFSASYARGKDPPPRHHLIPPTLV
jgi:hypothetical protein